jgi:hypothetical protein
MLKSIYKIKLNKGTDMNSKEVIVNNIKEILSLFPDNLDKIIFLEKTSDKMIEEYIARSLVTYSPVYLPFFERDGDLFALHISIKCDLYLSPILKLFHDAEFPIYLSSSIKYFPYCMMDALINIKRYYKEIIEPIKQILDKFSLDIPGEKYYQSVKDKYYKIIIDFDKDNLIMQIRDKTSMLFKKAALPIIEELYNKNKNRRFFICYCLVKSKLALDYDQNILLDCLKNEYSFSINDVGWYDHLDEGIRMMEAIKQNSLSIITQDNPFYLVKDIPLNDPKSIDKLLEIASIFSKKGDDITAVNQVRNACTIAGAYGNGLTKGLCKTLVEYTRKAEPDGLAYHLANFAVDVIDLGP